MKAKRIIFIFLFAFFFSSSLFAEGLLKKPLTQDSFNRNVRPLSRTIINQFYDLLEKISPEQSEMIQVKKQITDIQQHFFSWQRMSDELNPDKVQDLELIHKQLIKIEKLILDLQKQGLKLKPNSHGSEIDSRIDLADTLDEMSNQCFYLISTIENMLIYSRYQKMSLVELNSTLNFMRLDAERSFLNGLSDELQPHFDFVWSQFFKDLEFHVVMEGKAWFFEEKVESFNLSWNFFFSKMTSENFAIPKESRPYLENIHQNWKGILRQIVN